MSNLKTNVTIKFTSKSEVEKAIDSLVELGYQNDSDWNNDILFDDDFWDEMDIFYIHIYFDLEFCIYNHSAGNSATTIYESFTEFEKSLNH